MKELKQQKKKALNLFFTSIDKNLHLWKEQNNSFISEDFEDAYFKINEYYNEVELIIRNKRSVTLSRYKKSIFGDHFKFDLYYISNFKVWWYVRKVKNNFDKEEKRKKEEVEILKSSIDNINKKYVVFNRKEKLKKINN